MVGFPREALISVGHEIVLDLYISGIRPVIVPQMNIKGDRIFSVRVVNPALSNDCRRANTFLFSSGVWSFLNYLLLSLFKVSLNAIKSIWT